MFTKDKLEEYLERCLKIGADFAELFIVKNYKYIDSKLDDIIDSSDYGIGIRIVFGNDIVYGL